MATVLASLLRFAAILAGYCAAALAASAFLHVLFFAATGFEPHEAPAYAMSSFVFSIPFVALFVAYFGFIPAIAVVLVGEVLGRRDWLYHAIGGGVVAGAFLAFVHGAADPDFEVAGPRMAAAVIGSGIVGGLAYWLVAGRGAGSWRDRSRPKA